MKLAFNENDIAAWAMKESVDESTLSCILSFTRAIADRCDERAVEAITRLSRIPQKNPRLFSNFDTSRLPDDSKRIVKTLETLSFISASKNIIMIGPTGTGKTHLAQAIGNECCARRMKTYFIKMQELKEKFHNASSSATAGRLLSSFQKYQCLIVDEVGYCKMDEAETRLFFQMVDRLSMREKGSIILTSNRDIADWAEFFSDMDALECALDRLCNNAMCISFSGESYRGKGRVNVSLDFNNPYMKIGN